MAGIYIHIPFCKQACHYCDFHFSTTDNQRDELVKALNRELLLRKDYLQGAAVQTIYFGGGTPSLLSDRHIGEIMETLSFHYPIASSPEVTLEANPDDLDLQKVRFLKSAGINRLSIGIQSFQDHILKYLNRPHDAVQAKDSVILAQQAGFANISIDLIYAIPDQSVSEWALNIDEALSLNVQHISSYSLTIEPKTAFGNRLSKGRLIPVTDDVAAEQMEFLADRLVSSGFEHYEISNFSLPGFHSKHNSSYWRQQPYLGIGPSAHSYNASSRQFNISNNALYVKSLRDDIIPFEKELLSNEDHINEFLLTTLRTSWGTDLSILKGKFNYDLIGKQEAYIKNLVENNLAHLENGFLKLTRNGRLVADRISSDLFVEPNKI